MQSAVSRLSLEVPVSRLSPKAPVFELPNITASPALGARAPVVRARLASVSPPVTSPVSPPVTSPVSPPVTSPVLPPAPVTAVSPPATLPVSALQSEWPPVSPTSPATPPAPSWPQGSPVWPHMPPPVSHIAQTQTQTQSRTKYSILQYQTSVELAAREGRFIAASWLQGLWHETGDERVQAAFKRWCTYVESPTYGQWASFIKS